MSEEELKGFVSVTKFAEDHDMDVGNVRRYIINGRIKAYKLGKQWAIPAGTKAPEDKRIKNGKYLNARRRNSTEKRKIEV